MSLILQASSSGSKEPTVDGEVD